MPKKIHSILFTPALILVLAACSGGGTGAGNTAGHNNKSQVACLDQSKITGKDLANTAGSPNLMATLTWNAPATHMDGSPAIISGYIIHYGTSPNNYAYTVTVGTSACRDVSGVTRCSYTLTNLSHGTWYFKVTAYDSANSESGDSNRASKTL